VILYLDTSAYLKLYVEEAESAWLRVSVGQATICSHLIGYAEMRAGLARAIRMRRLSMDDHAYQLAQFERDWKSTRLVQTDMPLIRRAGDLAEHLAYGVTTASISPPPKRFGGQFRKWISASPCSTVPWPWRYALWA
jgi:predicted nucleic acid-binding protein